MDFDKNNPFFGMPSTKGMQLKTAFETLEPNITQNWMVKAIEVYFRSQKDFAKFIGVGPSTVTNWVNEGSFPDSSKRILVYTLLGKLNEISAAKKHVELSKAFDDTKRPMVIDNCGTFSILGPMLEKTTSSKTNRKIIAQHIAEFQTALNMAGSTDAWEFINESKSFFGEIKDRLLEVCDELALGKEVTERFESEISHFELFHLNTYNILKKKWTDPDTLKQEAEAFAQAFEDIDWEDAFSEQHKVLAGD
jgi:transcriptional regulator with XRE-family HTH domain